mmetsp:Transcript_31589/g.70737  ORF Transcript_31589/g.70737 Transcript_31589/m.70737 type:complete len:119 (-) Transcript_31589:310-666(-)
MGQTSSGGGSCAVTLALGMAETWAGSSLPPNKFEGRKALPFMPEYPDDEEGVCATGFERPPLLRAVDWLVAVVSGGAEDDGFADGAGSTYSATALWNGFRLNPFRPLLPLPFFIVSLR